MVENNKRIIKELAVARLNAKLQTAHSPMQHMHGDDEQTRLPVFQTLLDLISPVISATVGPVFLWVVNCHLY